MRGFTDRLKRQQAAFNRKVRRFVIIGVFALLCVITAVLYVRLKPAGRPPRITLQESRTAPPSVLALPEPRPDDPSQIIAPEKLFFVRDVNPVRALDGTERKVSVIDQDILLNILSALKDIPQDELRQRVDRSIRWEDFNDEDRRRAIKGRACMFKGTLRRLEKRDDIDVSGIGIQCLYEGQIQDVLGRWYGFFCFEKPRKEIKRTDVAILAGVFYKLIKYPTRRGEDMIVPLIVARTVDSRPGPAVPPSVPGRIIERTPPWALWLFAGVVFVGIGILILCGGGTKSRRRPFRVRPRAGQEDPE